MLSATFTCYGEQSQHSSLTGKQFIVPKPIDWLHADLWRDWSAVVSAAAEHSPAHIPAATCKVTSVGCSCRFLPDKAIDLIDEAGSRVRLRHAQLPEEARDLDKELRALLKEKDAAVRCVWLATRWCSHPGWSFATQAGCLP